MSVEPLSINSTDTIWTMTTRYLPQLFVFLLIIIFFIKKQIFEFFFLKTM